MLTARPTGELLAALSRDDVSAEELTTQFLRVLRRREPQVKAFLLVDEEGALAQARAVDARRRQGASVGSLAGMPVALKDVLCTKGQRTTCGSKILSGYIPPYDAQVVQ